MKFIIILGLLVFVVAANKKRSRCIPNVPLQENGCNDCHCPINGDLMNHLSCTRRGCANLDYELLRKCKPVGQTWTEGCNRCWCTQKFGTVCENKLCCIPNVPLQENGCNYCNCPINGDLNHTLPCTRMACVNPDYEWLRNCKPIGYSWKTLCNRCWCTAKMGTVCENKQRVNSTKCL